MNLISGLQQKNRDLVSHCDDLEEELKVKNTQYSAINMKYSEVEKLLQLEKDTSSYLKVENERFVKVFCICERFCNAAFC